MVVQQMTAWRTPWVNNKPAVTASHSEALALDTQACDLAFLEDVLQAGEVLDLPHKLPLEVFASADTLGLDSPGLCTNPFYAAAEGACFFDHVKSGCERGCVILHVSSLSIPEFKITLGGTAPRLLRGYPHKAPDKIRHRHVLRPAPSCMHQP